MALFALLLAESLPVSNGVAVDFHARPSLLPERVRWVEIDLNGVALRGLHTDVRGRCM